MSTGAELHQAGDEGFALLTACASAEPIPRESDRIRALAARQADWDRVLRLAERNGMSPLLFAALNASCRDTVPPETFARLREHVTRRSALGLLLWGTLLDILGRLSRSGIDAIPYKGPAAALAMYGHPTLRQFSDLDILVRQEDVVAAWSVLESEGFVPAYRLAPAQLRRLLRDDYVTLFRRDRGRTVLELHWAIAPRAFGVPFDGDRVFAARETLTFQGRLIHQPCAEHQLVMTCVHAARHGWDKLEAAAGVASIVGRPGLRWEEVLTFARQLRSERMVRFGLLLARRLFGARTPENTDVSLADEAQRVIRMMASDAGAPPAGWALLTQQLRLKDTMSGRVAQCVRQVSLPTTGDWSAVPLPRAVAFAYPLVRAFRLARNYGLNH